MEQKIKLKPKLLNQFNQIQAQKQQLTNAYNELNSRESILIEIALEAESIATEEVVSVKLEEDNLILEVKKEEKEEKQETE